MSINDDVFRYVALRIAEYDTMWPNATDEELTDALYEAVAALGLRVVRAGTVKKYPDEIHIHGWHMQFAGKREPKEAMMLTTRQVGQA